MDISFITSTDWTALWGAITTVTTFIGGIVAWIKNKAAKTATKNYETTQAFFDPDNNEVMTPTEDTPAKSWKMSDETKNYILASVPTDADKVDVLKQIEAAESAGYVDYKLTFSTGYYAITYGLINGGGITSAAESVSSVTSTPKTMLMKEAVFNVMTAAEDDEWKPKLRQIMEEKDAIGSFPYTISTDKWIYTINRAVDKYGNDYTEQYGTQYSAEQIHK